ncbi:MAG TPA: DUF2254 domain-containing protein [Rhodopila sp.]
MTRVAGSPMMAATAICGREALPRPSAPKRRRRLTVLFRAVLYALRGGFLVRPLVIALVLGAAGMMFSEAEETVPALGAWVPLVLFPSHADPQVAQVILSGIATSIMTVVSIVFAILLMTITLASMQFSPRILVSFVRDRTTQWTLGIFLGTFSYCMAALPAARALPVPFSPVATVAGAMLLALLCVGWLIFFIHHISQAISVNHIVDRIAGETERVIDELMPYPRRPVWRAEAAVPRGLVPGAMARRVPVASPASGYIRFVDTERLLAVAKAARLQVQVTRRVGHFVSEGVPLLTVSRGDRLDGAVQAALLSTFDVGPARTLQQDVEFGVIQIVDIALRAISPAVNDPSTAITCLDQLGRIMIRWIGREEPAGVLFDPPHVPRVTIPWIDVDGLLETAFEQIRHYAQSDLPVSLRLLRTLQDIAVTTEDAEIRRRLLARADQVMVACRGRLDEVALRRLVDRLTNLHAIVEAGG